MNIFGVELVSWLAALCLAGLMAIAWSFGWRLGQSRAGRGHTSGVNLADAIMALFGLLLGFTVSMSLAKHDQRRAMMVNDANCIGDFSSTAAMLKPVHQTKILPVVRGYVQLLLTPLNPSNDVSEVKKRLDDIQGIHSQILALVREAVQDGNAITVPLITTYNSFTSSHVSRLASLRDRLPGSILLLLTLAAIVTMVLQGQRMGETNTREYLPSLGMIVLISLVVWVILDLNEPSRGLITVSREPLERLLAGLSK